jgi:hypothetical protein
MEIRTFQGDEDILAEVGMEAPTGQHWNVTVVTAQRGGVNNPLVPEIIVPPFSGDGSKDEPMRLIVAYDLMHLNEQFEGAIERAVDESIGLEEDDREMYMQTAGAGVLNLYLNRALLKAQDYIEAQQ